MTRRAARHVGALCLGASLTSAPAAFAADLPSPLALSCLGCHQPMVNAREMPALDRLPPADIAAALRRSRDAPETGSIMARFAVKLTDADIDALARELGRKPRR